ncbi:MAG: hypothetical protein OXD01_01545, partial [Gammaproteobacteria bacterium]|nr:hypothetical protein [Gammaproteobacteria bacterium]
DSQQRERLRQRFDEIFTRKTSYASLKKTCRKLDISFWDYLTDRLGIGKKTIPPLPDIIAERAAVATGY